MSRVTRASWLTLMCAVAVTGCQRPAPEDKARDADSQYLAHLASRAKDPEAKERIELALSMSTNDVMDSVPILLNTALTRDSRSGQWHLGMALYDEDRDVLGVGICEEYLTTDAQRETLVEEYPIFVHNRQGPSEALLAFRRPIQARDSKQRKDEAQWRTFCLEGKGPAESGARTREEYTQTLPAIYVSTPVPNKVEVSIYLYDDAGHKSEAIRLSMPSGGN